MYVVTQSIQMFEKPLQFVFEDRVFSKPQTNTLPSMLLKGFCRNEKRCEGIIYKISLRPVIQTIVAICQKSV